MQFREAYWRISLVYLLVGVVWVFGTDYLFAFLEQTLQSDLVRPLRVAKSLTFVSITTVILYFLLRTFVRHLKAGNEYYKLLYTSSPVPILMADNITGQVLEANASAQALFDAKKPASELGQIEALFEPVEGQKVSAFFDVEVGSFKPCGLWKIKSTLHEEYFANCFSSRIALEGQDKLLIGFVNATAAVQAQRVAMSYADQLFEMQEKISDAIIVLDRDYRILRINSTLLSMIGVTREYLIGNVLWDLFPNSKETQFYAFYQEVLNKGVSVYFEDYYPHLDQWYRVSAYPTPEGLVAYLRDVSREKKDTARLAESDRNLNAVLQSTTDAVWYIDRGLKIVFSNAAADKLKAELHDAPLIEGLSIAAQADKSRAAQVVQSFQQAYAKGLEGQEVNTRLVVPYKNGYKATIELLVNPVKDVDGNIMGIGCFARDISDRVRAENLIRTKNERLRNIAWYQSHEVRGPVASLLGLAKIFNYADAQDPINKEVLQHVRSLAEKLDFAIRSIVQETQDNV
jgi:PAS domain S-box-containing protein